FNSVYLSLPLLLESTIFIRLSIIKFAIEIRRAANPIKTCPIEKKYWQMQVIAVVRVYGIVKTKIWMPTSQISSNTNPSGKDLFSIRKKTVTNASKQVGTKLFYLSNGY